MIRRQFEVERVTVRTTFRSTSRSPRAVPHCGAKPPGVDRQPSAAPRGDKTVFRAGAHLTRATRQAVFFFLFLESLVTRPWALEIPWPLRDSRPTRQSAPDRSTKNAGFRQFGNPCRRPPPSRGQERVSSSQVPLGRMGVAERWPRLGAPRKIVADPIADMGSTGQDPSSVELAENEPHLNRPEQATAPSDQTILAARFENLHSPFNTFFLLGTPIGGQPRAADCQSSSFPRGHDSGAEPVRDGDRRESLQSESIQKPQLSARRVDLWTKTSSSN